VGTLTNGDFIEAVRREAGFFGDLLTRTDLSLDQAVSHCPGWRVRDLVGHLGGVHRWATEIVRSGDHSTDADRPSDDDLPAWFDEGAEILVRTLRAADPARPCWTLAPPNNVGFWSRRQAQETMVHRWDLATALGRPAEIAPSLAADGIDEAVGVLFPRQVRLRRMPPLTDVVAVVDTDSGRRWILAGDGTSSAGAGAVADATVSGDATTLLLVLWKRAATTDGHVHIEGNLDAARRVLDCPLTP
jgi:uncharacterized protein (TIGR03083 family)